MYEGDLVRLRNIKSSDMDAILEGFNNYDMRRFLDNPIPFSRKHEEEWLKNAETLRMEGKAYFFAIEDKETGELLGSTGLEQIQLINRSAELGITIYNSNNWDKGYGTDCMNTILSVGFNTLNLHLIYLRVHEFNERALKVYKKVGFKPVGRLREAHFLEGKYHDTIFMDILAREFRELYNK